MSHLTIASRNVITFSQMLQNTEDDFRNFCNIVDENEAKHRMTAELYHADEKTTFLYRTIYQKMVRCQSAATTHPDQTLRSRYMREVELLDTMIQGSSQYQRVMYTLAGEEPMRILHWRDSGEALALPRVRPWTGAELPISPCGSWQVLKFYYGSHQLRSEKRQKLDRDSQKLSSGPFSSLICSYCDFQSLANLSGVSYPFKLQTSIALEQRKRLCKPFLEEAEKVLNESGLGVNLDALHGFQDASFTVGFIHNWQELTEECQTLESISEIERTLFEYFTDMIGVALNDKRLDEVHKLLASISDDNLSSTLRDCLKSAMRDFQIDRSLDSEQLQQLLQVYSNQHRKMNLHVEDYAQLASDERFSALSYWGNQSSHKLPADALMLALNHYETIDQKVFYNEDVKLLAFKAIANNTHTLETLYKALNIAMRFQSTERDVALRAIFSEPLSPQILEQLPDLIQRNYHRLNQGDLDQILGAFFKYQGLFISVEKSLEIIAMIRDDNERALVLCTLLDRNQPFTEEESLRAHEIVGGFEGKNAHLLSMRLQLQPLRRNLILNSTPELVQQIRILLKDFPEEQDLELRKIGMILVGQQKFKLALEVMEDIKNLNTQQHLRAFISKHSS